MRTISAALLCFALATTIHAGVLSKIDPILLRTQGGQSRAIVVSKDSSRPGGLAFRRAEINRARMSKLAADTSVVALLPNRPLKVPPVPDPRQSWFQTTPWGGITFRQDPITPSMWMAVQIQNAPKAWASGYTGKGVKIAIVDEGVDFGQPDLQGCQARVTDPSSPYCGWPIAFDPSAMAIYASTGDVSGGYCDTTDAITESDPTWRDQSYVLPGTSKSGVYHIGPHPSYWLPFIVGRWGFPPAVLVVDEHEAGVYDTVYVDINKDLDFRNDKPCRKGDEISSWDADGDGLADYSAGMLYFISDGIHPIPASDWLYHTPAPENGCLVCFAGSFGKYDAHGTLVASAISARGKVGANYKIPQKPANSGGMVFGVAPGAGIIQVGSIYGAEADLYDAIQFCIYGYDGKPGTGDDADIVNMSFGQSAEDMDGWDFLSRYISLLNKTDAPRTTFVAASGNGGPGYGTVNSPGGAATATTVGAATMYGSTNAYDQIETASQILSGDIQQWSDRGPNSLGQVKPEVVAIGAWATGDVPIYGDGMNSWAVWAGTSLSAPVTSGILSLVYEAYRTKHGQYPTYDEARTLLMSGANSLDYNVFEQGAGMVDALKATRLAAGTGGFEVRPSKWAPGSYQGAQPEAFPHVMMPGDTTSATFAVENTGPISAKLVASGKKLVRTLWTQFDVSTKLSAEDAADVTKPDYILDITKMVPKNTSLLRVRVSMPYQYFSFLPPAFPDVAPASLWMVSLYDWTDFNHDRRVWDDFNHNGAVNAKEFQYGEVNRFMLANPTADVVEISVRNPLDRIHNGLLLGFVHSLRSQNIPVTTIKVELEAYTESNWDWLSVPTQPINVPARGKVSIPVTLKVPAKTTPGVYTGSLIVQTFNETTPVGVVVPVSASIVQGTRTSIGGTIAAGMDGAADTYDNGRMFGSYDWSWRDESGDWRFYFLDIPQSTSTAASYTLANANWRNVPSDTDILIYQPNKDDFFSKQMPGVFGPTGLTLSGASRRTLQHDGLWLFQTATGGTSEWVAGPSQPGLNLIQLHNVLASGYSGSEPFDLKAGQVTLDPAKLDLPAGQTSASLKFTSTIGLSGISAIGYGPSLPTVLANQPVGQDYPFDPKYSSWRWDFDVQQAGLIDITVKAKGSADIDLYLLHDSNTDGTFDWSSEVVAVSATENSAEHIRYLLPGDGKYRIAVHGFKVPEPTTFDLSYVAVQGEGIMATAPSGPVLPGTQQNISLRISGAQPGSTGVLFLGPTEAPYVLPVDVILK